MAKHTLMAHQKAGVEFLDSVDGVGALLWDPGVGKQQPVSEPVLTPNGWSPIGDVQPGDYVIGSDGQPTEVLSRHPQADRRVFRVTFSDGAWTDTGPDHLWSARTHNDTNRGRSYRVVTTEQLGSSLGSRWEIPMTAPVGGADVVLPVDPYFYGVMLGDAAQRSEEKAVDSRYMRASAAQRLALLQGLLDTDGSPIRTGGVEFSSTSPHLRDAVVELTESLGGSVRVGTERYPTYTYKGEKRTGQLSYRVNVKMPAGLLPFRLSRKLGAWVAPVKYNAKRVVRSVDYVREEDSVCIRVDAPDSLYLTRRHIVTHNTGTTAAWIDRLAARKGEVRVLVVAPLTAADQWVLQPPAFMDSVVKARMLQGRTVDMLTKIRNARDWMNVPETAIQANHRGDGVSRNRVTILSMSAGAVSNYCKVRAQTVKMLQAVRKYAPDVIVVDESHLIKAHGSNISKAMYQIGQVAPHRIILTGTVNPKDALDCYGQWRFLAPWTFSDQHGAAFTKSPLTMTVAQQKSIRPWSWGRFRDTYADMAPRKNVPVPVLVGLNDDTIGDLHARVAERSNVVRKEDALDLPPVQDVDVHVRLSPTEDKAYAQMRDELVAEMADGSLLEAPNALAKIMKLRQITAGFARDTVTEEVHIIGDAKRKAVAEVVNVTLAGENRVVVFAYFRSECAMLGQMLAQAGRTVEVITGQTKAKDRLAIRQRFADVSGNPEQIVLVAQARTMSLSVNELVVAQNAVYASMSERRDDWVQSRGRLDRNGQVGKHVTFWNVFVPGTVDEVMLDTHKRRGNLEKALLDYICNSGR